MGESTAKTTSDVDVDIRLSENNAPRRCGYSDCDHDAEWYVLRWGVISKYVCDGEHHEWALQQTISVGDSGEEDDQQQPESKTSPETNGRESDPSDEEVDSHWDVS